MPGNSQNGRDWFFFNKTYSKILNNNEKMTTCTQESNTGQNEQNGQNFLRKFQVVLETYNLENLTI